jgi:hypothetical protein
MYRGEEEESSTIDIDSTVVGRFSYQRILLNP